MSSQVFNPAHVAAQVAALARAPVPVPVRRSPICVRVGIALLACVLTVACGQPVAATIDDATITAQVKTLLLNDAEVDGVHIDVETALGVVTMAGTVASTTEEQRALRLARTVPGVHEVTSRLQITP